MECFGFAAQWLNLVLFCASSVTYQVRINSALADTIKPSAGIRQGDPLSPFIFILCQDVLARAWSSLVESGTVKPVRLSRTGPPVSQLLFADDVVFCMQANITSCSSFRALLKLFCAESGQRVNCDKSLVFASANVPQRHQKILSKILGYRQSSSFDNLGSPSLMVSLRSQSSVIL